jgi:hypothetical protein
MLIAPVPGLLIAGQTKSDGPPVDFKPRTTTVVCEECETPREVSDSTMMRWRMGAASEPERTCRVCGLVPSRCPVGGM